MYIFGNMDTTRIVSKWKKVKEILPRDGNTDDALQLCCPRYHDIPLLVTTPSNFARLSPEAGCNHLCEKQLQCGHACIAKCHSDMLHEAVFCMKRCAKLKNGCQHTCPKLCGQRCVPRYNILIQDIKLEFACGPRKEDIAMLRTSEPVFYSLQEPEKPSDFWLRSRDHSSLLC
jgi:hypothetical protein